MARIIDVIEAPDQQRNQMVVRLPEVGSGDFRMGSAVNVRESQTAVFYRDGKAMDVFQAGRHHITTANLPLLAQAGHRRRQRLHRRSLFRQHDRVHRLEVGHSRAGHLA
jgi:membrane protease subunit (stomatin/prohibitin family)